MIKIKYRGKILNKFHANCITDRVQTNAFIQPTNGSIHRSSVPLFWNPSWNLVSQTSPQARLQGSDHIHVISRFHLPPINPTQWEKNHFVMITSFLKEKGKKKYQHSTKWCFKGSSKLVGAFIVRQTNDRISWSSYEAVVRQSNHTRQSSHTGYSLGRGTPPTAQRSERK